MDYRKIQDKTDARRATQISKAFNKGANLPHTCEMIYYAEASLDTKEKKEEMLRTVLELELVYKENNKKISDCLKDGIEKLLACSKADIELKDYWAGIYDIFYIENIFLRGVLSEFPITTESFQPRLLLTKKILQGCDGYIFREDSEPEDPADWWKN